MDFVDFNNGLNNSSLNNTTNNVANNMSSNNGTQNNTTGEYCPLTGQQEPEAMPSVHDVRFLVESEYPNTVWIATEGFYCTPFSVTNEQGDTLPLALGARCGCECPYPGSPGPMMLLAVDPGVTVEVQWDGRELLLYQECVECWDDWGMPPIFGTAGAAR